MNGKQKKLITRCFILFLFLSAGDCIAQKKRSLKDPGFVITPSTPIKLEKELSVFNDSNANAYYRISIGADIPNNKNPMQIHNHFEPGHLFLILQKITAIDTIHKVFGFYPLHVAVSLFKKNVKSQIKDNSKREHDVVIGKTITPEQFQTVVDLALQYSKNKYDLNTFNCYDYVLKIFNAVAEKDTLPSMYIRYPLFFGRGGSPCSFYKYMRQQKDSGHWSPYILFGNLVAPVSTKYNKKL